MAALRLKGYVNQAGELKFDPPVGLVPGEVTITIESEDDDLQFEGKTNGEILGSDLIGAWAHLEIEDSQAFVDEIRNREREQRGL